jgi:hypothetical protein
MANKKDKPSNIIVACDPVALRAAQEIEKAEREGKDTSDPGMLGLILKSLQGQQSAHAERMAFEVDPQANTSSFASLYRDKTNLTPDFIIKRITGPNGDELVCQILQARSNHISSFGRPRSSRFALGFDFEEIDENSASDNKEAFKAQRERLTEIKRSLWNCGSTGLTEDFHPNLSQFLKMITRDGMAFGRFAVEVIWAKDPKTGEDKPHSFRAVDAGTIRRIAPYREKDQSTRQQALRMLQDLKNEKFSSASYEKDQYKWVQVVEGRPLQAFTEKELVIYNLNPVTNIEYNGYPLTPIDQALNAITTHINITIHNKLYFQNGRASKGILVFKSDNIDEQVVQKVRLQFNQSINSVHNSHRLPVFGCGAEESIEWQQIDVQGRDQEFQFLMESNSRIILGAFQMSPDELPGYAHLSKGSNTQSLSESSNEYKLTAMRDVGLRPLVYDIQDFFNSFILPIFFSDIAKTHQMILAGLDKDDPEKESTRLQQDQSLHMTYDEILERVEKDKIGKELGGAFPLNPAFQQVIQTYQTFGQTLESFFGVKGASKDPRYDFYLNPMWMQYQQMVLQKAQIAMQNQQMQMQQMQQQMNPQQGQSGEGGGDQESGGDEQPPTPPNHPMEQSTEKMESYKKEVGEYLKKNQEFLSKTVNNNHHKLSRMILARQKSIAKKRMDEWTEEAKLAVKKIREAIEDPTEDPTEDSED